MKLDAVQKRQVIIASYVNYDVLTHGSGNMWTQTVAASTCKVYPLLGGGQTAGLTQSYLKILHNAIRNYNEIFWIHMVLFLRVFFCACGYCICFVRLMSMGSSKKKKQLFIHVKIGPKWWTFSYCCMFFKSSIFIWWLWVTEWICKWDCGIYMSYFFCIKLRATGWTEFQKIMTACKLVDVNVISEYNF